MIKKSVLDAIEKKLTYMRGLHSFLKKHHRKNDGPAKNTYLSLKREARAVDTLMRDAVKRGDVEFTHENKARRNN